MALYRLKSICISSSNGNQNTKNSTELKFPLNIKYEMKEAKNKLLSGMFMRHKIHEKILIRIFSFYFKCENLHKIKQE